MEHAPVIYLVDDDEAVLRSLARVLAAAGYGCEAHTSAEAFLARHDPEAPGCVILDLGLPGMDGFEVQQKLSAGALERSVIFLTGLGDIPASVRAMKAGAVDFLTKPVEAGALLAAVVLPAREGQPGKFATPRGSVLLLAGLAAATFLVEGAVLDWSALLLVGRGLVEAAKGGVGYMLFAVAMTIGRLTGDRIVANAGNRRVLLIGGSVAAGGIAVAVVAPWAELALIGFLLIGFGAANIVPVLFSLAGRQAAMPVGLAIAAVTTTGYAGKLVGPAVLGFVSQATSLPTAFWLLAGIMALVPLFARVVTR